MRISINTKINTLALTLLCLLASLPLNTQAQSIAGIAARGYIYGLPLVLMGETLDGLTGPARSCKLGTDLNTFANVFDRPDASFKAVVRPNVDTLYSSAMLDLSAGPQLLTMPAVQGRYVLMAFLDAWSNNFAGVGTQNQGDLEGRYVIVGPHWNGPLPDGYVRIDAPTNLVWIIGRTELKSDEDIPTVNAIQRQYRLTPWAHENQASGIDSCVPESQKTPPVDVVTSLSAIDFFSRLSELMKRYPPPAADADMVAMLGKIGVGPKATISLDDLSPAQKKALAMGQYGARRVLKFSTRLLGLTGWGPNPALIPLGDYGKRYFIRAVVAMVGFGANQGKFAVYQNADRDSHDRRLDGHSVYTLTFPADALPPVKAFWSLTVYGDDGFLRDNPAAAALGFQRYAVGSNTGLATNPDGSVTLYMADTLPEGIPQANWLPTPDARFQVTIRLYDPDESILEHRWKVPPIIRQ